MTPVTEAMFYMGRDKTYAKDLTPAIRLNAIETIKRANVLLTAFYAANPSTHQRAVNSGWRPPAVNANVPGAAKLSKHMTGQAIDIGDDDDQLDAWCMSATGQTTLEKIGLWLEHPSATPRWCHVQTVPPGSGRRVFYP